MPASINDKLKKYKSLFSTTLSTGIGTGTSDTITPATVTGLPTDTAITLTIDRVDASGTATPSKMERIKGVVSSGNIINYVRAVDGTTEQAHTAGAVVEMVWNADDWNNAVDHLLVEHGQDGKHTKVNGNTVTAGTDTVALLTASQTLTNKTLTSPKINENVALTSTATELNLLHGKLGAWTSSTPTPTAGSGSFTSVACQMQHIQIGKIVFIAFVVNITTNGSAAVNVTVPLPVNSTGRTCVLAGRESGVTGKMLQGFVGASSVSVTDYANAYCGGDGYALYISGSYQCA
jgi:hypothetical protein